MKDRYRLKCIFFREFEENFLLYLGFEGMWYRIEDVGLGIRICWFGFVRNKFGYVI